MGCHSPGDQAAGELEECSVVFGFLRPADQQAPEAIAPGVGTLDDPAVCAEAGLVQDRRSLLAAGADVGGESKLGAELVHLGIVVALVETESVRLAGSSVRPLDQDARERRAEELEVVDVRPGELEPDRDAAAFADDGSLRPLFALSVGFGPV